MTILLEKKRLVLRLQEAVLTTDPYAGTVSDRLNLEIHGGELMFFRLARVEQMAALSDACVGIAPPLQGAIFVQGQNWQDLPPHVANALRGRTGHVFVEGNWIPNLTVMENILVQQLYHTRHGVHRILHRAGALAEAFGLPGVPRGLPGDFTAADLQRSALVRAFLGRPLMILLQEPTGGLGADILAPLIQAVRDARFRGAAVIWMTARKDIWNDATIPATRRYRLVARSLREVTM